MKKVKYIIGLLSLLLIIPLASCDLSIILGDSSKLNDDKTDTDENKDDNKEETQNDDNINNDDKDIEVDYDMNLYLNDYHNNFGYLALEKDLEHGLLMQQAYSEYYEASKALLLSKEDYEVSTSVSDGIETKFLSVYETADIAEEALLPYYISAWSVFVSDNPIFYFLSNGYLARTKVSTKTTTKGNVETTETTTTYTFILVGFEEYTKFSKRDEINKKIYNLFEETKGINELSDDYTKASQINDYLIQKLEYAYKTDGRTPEDSFWAHNIIGLLLKNKGVCECYTKCFRLMATYYGLNAISVYGKTKTSNESHAWNYLKLGDNWYGVDVTWNDSTHTSKYFLCSNSVMSEDHNPYATIYGINYQPEVPALCETGYVVE